MWQGSLNRKRLITGMTVILLLAVYTGMYIVLPAARQTAGKNEMSESRQEENQTAQADRQRLSRFNQPQRKAPLMIKNFFCIR